MFDFLFQMSDGILFFSLSCFFIFLSIVFLFIVQRYISHDLRTRDNTTVGYVSDLVSMIYSVLVGLTALYLFNVNNYAANAVQAEANAVADIYRDSRWLAGNVRTQIQGQIDAYLKQVINKEWPLMQMGEGVGEEGAIIIDKINESLEGYKVSTNMDLLILHEMLGRVKALYDARGTRVQMSTTGLSNELWLVILIGTFLTLGINYLYAMNFYMHMVTVCAAALMTSSMIFLLITLDRPFQGEFVIEPDALRSVLNYIHR